MKISSKTTWWTVVGLLLATTSSAVAAPLSWTGLGGINAVGNPFNWNPQLPPGKSSNLIIGDIVPDAEARWTYDSGSSYASLELLNNAELRLDDEFYVDPESLSIAGSTILRDDSKLIIGYPTGYGSAGGVDFSTGDLRVFNSASIEKVGGSTISVFGKLTIGAGASYGVSTSLHLASDTALINDGLLTGGSFSTPNGALLDLDGVTDSGSVVLDNKSLFLSGEIADDFDGIATITKGTMTVQEAWTASDASIIELTGGTLSHSNPNPTAFTAEGDLFVYPSDVASRVAREFILAGGTLRLSAATPANPDDTIRRLNVTGKTTFSDGATIALNHEDALLDLQSIATSSWTNTTILGPGRFQVARDVNLGNGVVSIDGSQGNFAQQVYVGGPAMATVNLTGGANVTADRWYMNSQATTNVSGGNGSEPTMLTADSFIVSGFGTPGQPSQAELVITGGGKVLAGDEGATHAAMRIASDSYSDGLVSVSGVSATRSELDVRGSLEIGFGEPSHGGLEVSDGALVRVGRDVRLASTHQIPGFAGTATVNIGGQQNGHAAELIVDGNVRYRGGLASININNGGRLEAEGLYLQPGGTLNLSGGELKLNTLDVTAGGNANFNAGRFDVDNIFGEVDLENVDVIPGNSPGTMTFHDSFTLSNTRLEIEIGGYQVSSEHDFIAVDGSATLDGTLAVSLYDLGSGLFSPTFGDQFEIVSTTAGVFGEFDQLLTPNLSPGLAWELLYNPLNVILAVVATIEGDYDADGDVDSDDLNQWEDNYGDGEMDGRSLLSWQQNYTGPSAGAQAAISAVPEPTSFVLFACGLGMLLGARRRQ